MAVSLSRLKQAGAKQASAQRLAKEYEKQQARESKRSGWSSLLGGVGGKLLGGALTGFLGLTGVGAPIAMALGSMLGKKGAHELTRGMGAKTGALTAGEYGYGGAEAKTLREGLEGQMRASDPFKQRGAFGGELLSSYVSAGMSGGLKGSLKDFGKESFIKTGEGAGLLGGGGLKGALEGGKAGLGQAFGDVTTWGGEEEEAVSDFVPTPGGGQFNPITGEELSKEGWSFQEGGFVPNKAPTISEYFGMQGVSLGGSHKQSIGQMLGER